MESMRISESSNKHSSGTLRRDTTLKKYLRLDKITAITA